MNTEEEIDGILLNSRRNVCHGLRIGCPAELAIGGVYKTPEQGAATSVWCATSHQLDGKGGVYCMDCDIAPVQTDFSLEGMGQMLTGVPPWAIDPELGERLWQLSEQMTGAR